MKVTAEYDGPVHAPVAKGEPVGRLVVSAPDVKDMSFPLVAAAPVGKLGPLARVATAAGYLIWGPTH